MAFPPALLDEIRDRMSVSEVVGRRVQWDRRKTQAARGDYWACCPFHNEKSPSFHADDRKGRYHCFGCGAGGDIFRFVMETEGLAFPEAVEMLAGLAGVVVPRADPQEAERAARRATLVEVMEKAAAFYAASLRGPGGRAARDYLAGRGLGLEAAERFGLGYAASGRHALKDHLAGEGIGQEQMIEAGLLIAGPDIAVSFDRFRDRIIYPIPDSRGRVIAFGGRALSPDAQAKYLNSPDTPVFSKGNVLYNYAAAMKPARLAGTVIVAEGYMDVIALAMAGFENAVAPLGTALTDRQIQLLWRLAPEPILCFDGDVAGQRAARRAADTALPLLKPGHSIRFAFMPQGQDPDDLLRAAGAGAMAEVIEGARPLVEVVWESESAEAPDTPEQRAALETRLEEVLSRIAEDKVRKHYRSAFAERLSRLWAQRAGPGSARTGREDGRNRFGRGFEPRGAVPRGPTPELRRSALARDSAAAIPTREALILVTLINHPALIEAHLEEIAGLDLSAGELDSLRRQLIDIAACASALEHRSLKAQLREQGFAAILNRLERALSHGGDRFAHPGTAVSQAEIGWLHVVARQRKAVTLERELGAAEQAFAGEPSEQNYALLAGARAALDAFEGNEVAIEGFADGGAAGSRTGTFDAFLAANRHRLP